MKKLSQVESETGNLFSDLWYKYDDKLFVESVELFHKRIALSGFDRSWFHGKTVLDAGCGGGRNSIAMASLGCEKVFGIDVGEEGLVDARKRASEMSNVEFKLGSVMNLPFEDDSFDLIWHAGVLMITDDPEVALKEITRVLKPSGYLYLLVYATEGLRWPLINLIRPVCMEIGYEKIDSLVSKSGLKSNSRRTFLDDLFCPKLDFFHWERLNKMLEVNGYSKVDRWGPDCRLDHEHSLDEYKSDLERLSMIFSSEILNPSDSNFDKLTNVSRLVSATIAIVDSYIQQVEKGNMSESEAMNVVIGQGHHRVLAKKH